VEQNEHQVDKIAICEALLEELRVRSEKDNLITMGVEESLAESVATEWGVPCNMLEDLITYLKEDVKNQWESNIYFEKPKELPYDVWHFAENVSWAKEVTPVPLKNLIAFKSAFGREIGYEAGLLQLDVGQELLDCSCNEVSEHDISLHEGCIHYGDRCGTCGAFIIEACEVGDGEAMYHGRHEDCGLMRRLVL
jgi:hypothetical protein|tara:strand:+ start:374 stop:955 length:582 start_codon:yes stop_codon:yes gene_type:complete